VLIELAGAGAAGTAYDQINVTGAATLAGTLDIDLLDGFVPTVGQTFQVFTWGSYSGQFDHYSGLDLTNGTRIKPVYSATGLQLQVVENPDQVLDATLVTKLDNLAQDLIALKASLTTDADADGNLIVGGVLAEILPGTDASLDTLLGYQDIFELGSFIRHYLNKVPEAEAVHPLGDYAGTEGSPSFAGLVTYLNTNWIPTLDGATLGDLGLVNENGNVALTFENRFQTTTTLTLDIGDPVRDLGLSLDADLTAEVAVNSAVELGFTLDVASGALDFQLGDLNFTVTASATDLVLGAEFGPLAVSLGSAGGQKGSLTINLSGSVGRDANGDFALTTGNDSLVVDLPVYAELAGVNLSAISGLPRLLLEGHPLSSDADLSVTTQNFDALTHFPDLAVADLMLLFPTLVNTLDAVRNQDGLVATIPFADATVQGVADFGKAFETAIYDEIDFTGVQTLQGFVTAVCRADPIHPCPGQRDHRPGL